MIGICLFPLLDTNPYHIEILVNCGLFVLLALGLNVIIGFSGQLNLGYAAFFAMGAYTYALLNLRLDFPFWAALPLCAVVAALFGVLLSFPALRLRGDYLAIVTLGFGEIARIVANNLDAWTGGPNGLMGIAHPQLTAQLNFSVHSWPYYYLILCFILITVFLLHRLKNSRIGRAWVAIREDELAAACMGVSTTRFKLIAMGVGASIAGVAGCFFAAKQGAVTPDSFDFIVSIMVVSMVVLGGMGTLHGVVLGSILLSLLPELFRNFQSYRMLIFGLAMVLIMLLRPQGLLGDVQHKEELKHA